MHAPRAVPLVLCLALFAAALVAGCGSRTEKSEVTFEPLDAAPDTAGLTQGDPLLVSLEPSRTSEGAVTLAGRVRLPESTKVQVAVKVPGGEVAMAMAHVFVHDGGFVTTPLMGDEGPLKQGRYRVEVLVPFTPDWQTAEVLRATGDGKRLRGPGITRGRDGRAALFLTREVAL